MVSLFLLHKITKTNQNFQPLPTAAEKTTTTFPQSPIKTFGTERFSDHLTIHPRPGLDQPPNEAICQIGHSLAAGKSSSKDMNRPREKVIEA